MYHAVKHHQKIGHQQLWNVISSAAIVLNAIYTKYISLEELLNAK